MSEQDIDKAERLTTWMRRKIRIHETERKLLFQEGEIWWVSLGENIGDEANGKHEVFERPIVIIRHLSQRLVFVVPVTTKAKMGNWFHCFDFRGGARWAVLAQARVISSKRLVRRMGMVTPHDFDGIRKAFLVLINNGPLGQ